MKAKIKSGNQFLFSEGCLNTWNKITNCMIINFNNKDTYNSFKQVKNHLFIDTTEGEIDIVFSGEVPKLEFDNFCKDQLVLKVVDNYNMSSDSNSNSNSNSDLQYIVNQPNILLE